MGRHRLNQKAQLVFNCTSIEYLVAAEVDYTYVGELVTSTVYEMVLTKRRRKKMHARQKLYGKDIGENVLSSLTPK